MTLKLRKTINLPKMNKKKIFKKYKEKVIYPVVTIISLINKMSKILFTISLKLFKIKILIVIYTFKFIYKILK